MRLAECGGRDGDIGSGNGNGRNEREEVAWLKE